MTFLDSLIRISFATLIGAALFVVMFAGLVIGLRMAGHPISFTIALVVSGLWTLAAWLRMAL